MHPLAADVVGERFGDPREVDDAGLRGGQRLYARRVRLDLAQPVGVEAPKARHAVRVAASLELVEAGQLALVEGDDQLAAALRLDPARVAVLVERTRALHAQRGLQRTGRVVDARVDDAARMARLV